MLSDYIERIMMIYNLIDDIVIVDKDGILVYAESFKKYAYSFDMNSIIGKHLFEVYPSSSPQNSSLYNVLQTKEPMFHFYNEWTSFTGDKHSGISDTLPIFIDDELAGAVEIARFSDEKFKLNEIRFTHDNMGLNQSSNYSLDDIVSNNPKMYELKKKISKVSRSTSTVLIYGETGTGKEMVAQSIHSKGDRKKKPFISQNCAAIPSSLLESILFGTEKGGFTGAEDRKGLFEMAEGGTLFLDEINSMDYDSQSKLLKVIEERKIMRIGGKKYIPTNVRILCAMSEAPITAMKNNHLREDLFYRLSAIILELPPLRERTGDIPLLIDTFINQYSDYFDSNIKGISDDLYKVLTTYSWPGNVRQLKNVIEGAFNLSDNQILEISDIPSYILSDMAETSENNTDTLISEKERVINALRNHKTKTKAAEFLGISKQALNYRIKKYNIKI